MNKEDQTFVFAAMLRLAIVVLYHISFTKLIKRNIFYIGITLLLALGVECDLLMLIMLLSIFKLIT